MEMRQIRQFLAVVDRGSFSGAAASLGITQQALSKGISNFEDELGVRVFDRDTRNVTLSRFGNILLAHARNIEAEAQQFRRHLDDTIGVRSGHLKIGVGLTAATYVVPFVVKRLIEKRANLRVTVTDGTAAALTPMLLRGELDAIVCVIGHPLEESLVKQDVLFKERLRVLASGSHDLAGAKRVALKRLLSYPWFVGWSPGGFDAVIGSSFEREGLSPPVTRIETTSLPLARSLLTEGPYLAVLPEHLFSSEITAGTVVVIDVNVDQTGWERPMTLCYRRNSARSPATMAMIDELDALLKGKNFLIGLQTKSNGGGRGGQRTSGSSAGRRNGGKARATK